MGGTAFLDADARDKTRTPKNRTPGTSIHDDRPGQHVM
jgi:hypothetical protein